MPPTGRRDPGRRAPVPAPAPRRPAPMAPPRRAQSCAPTIADRFPWCTSSAQGDRAPGATQRVRRRFGTSVRSSRVGDGGWMNELELLEWKRRVFALYAHVRAEPEPARAVEAWRAGRDELFAGHPQSPLPAARRAGFAGL